MTVTAVHVVPWGYHDLMVSWYDGHRMCYRHITTTTEEMSDAFCAIMAERGETIIAGELWTQALVEASL